MGANPAGRRWVPLALGAAGILLALIVIIAVVVATQRASGGGDGGAAGGGGGSAGNAVAEPGEGADVAVFHHLRVDLQGPQGAAGGAFAGGGGNVFSDVRLECVFRHAGGNVSAVVQGFYAADGDAAETGAAAGRVWRCMFTPWLQGEWTWAASCVRGADVAVGAAGGERVAPDGKGGRFVVGPVPAERDARDGRAKGRLRYVGRRYLRFEGDGEWFLSGGNDSPEGLLNYADFDGALQNTQTRTWAMHVQDWREGDPTWKGGKGKGLIGLVNYLATLRLNSISFLLFSYLGSDGGVFPTVDDPATVRDVYNVAKLEQWRVVFDHMERSGLMMHMKLSEVQSVKYWDNGALGRQKKLYYREMIARFGHYNAIVWNLGEELANEKPPELGVDFRIEPVTIRAYGLYVSSLDPMEHPVALHTWPTDPIKREFYTAVIADGAGTAINVFSVQGQAEILRFYLETKRWVDASAAAGVPKVVTNDEQGPFRSGVASDARDASHFLNRTGALWPPVLAGGAGHLTYFGFAFPDSDIDVRDMRTYEGWFKQVVIMLDFFRDNAVPFQDMVASDELASNGMYTFYKPGEVYIVQVVSRYATSLDLRGDTSVAGFAISWVDAARGGAPAAGSVDCAPAGAWAALGTPPGGAWRGRDWIALLRADAGCGAARGVRCGGAFVRADAAAADTGLSASVAFSLVDARGAPLPGGTAFAGETGLCNCGVAEGGVAIARHEGSAVTLQSGGGRMWLSCSKLVDVSGQQCAPSLVALDGTAC